MADTSLKEQFERNKEDFILVEIESGHTFAALARDTQDAARATRNLANARKAYDTALDFLRRKDVTDPEVRKKITSGLAELKLTLVELGEEFDD